MSDVFTSQRDAAMALLTRGPDDANRLSRRAGSFLGQLAVDPTPMSEAQRNWLATLLDRAGMPQLGEIADHG